MNTLGGVSLEVVVRQPLWSTLAEQQLNLSFTGKENKQDPPWKNEPVRMEICAMAEGQWQSLTFCQVMLTKHMNEWCSTPFQDPLLNLKL